MLLQGKKGDSMLDVTAVLFAKGVSSRFPGKNLKPFAKKDGKTVPLLEWKIIQLLEVFKPENILLSSDSEEIFSYGKKYGLKLHERSTELANADMTTNLQAAASAVSTKYFMYTNGPCYPLIFPELYKEYLNFCAANKQYLSDGIFAVETIKGFLVYDENFLNFTPNNMLYSQDLKNVERIVWGLATRETAMVLERGSLMENTNKTFVISNLEAIDIDYENDFILAQAVLGDKIPSSKI
jgi:CMP-N-acetylneuraminic acid synthetase